MPDDAQLLRLYAEERSEAAFAELVRRHLDLVYSAALRQVGGDAHSAHDVAQTVFTALARKADAVARHPVLVGWLYTSTQHAAAKVRRSEARRRVREQEAQRMSDVAAGDAPAVDWEQLSPLLDEAMRELNDHDREAVLLRFFARRPFAEIGATMCVSEDAARMRVERALEKLRAVLARRGVTSTGAALGVVLANQAVGAAPAGLAGTVVGVATAAGVVGGGGTSLGIFTFMSTGKIVVGVAIVCAAVGIGSAVYQAGEVTRANAEVAALQRERAAAHAKTAALAVKVRENEASARAAAERVAGLEGQVAAAKKTVGGGAAPGAPAVATGNAANLVWSKPGYARLYVEKYRAGLRLRYGALYRALNLTVEETAKFEAVMTEHQQGLADVWSEAESRGLSTSGDTATATAVARLTSEPAKLKADGLLALLGIEKYQRMKEFETTFAARETITALAGSIYASESPLTAEQGEGIAKILVANTRQVRTPVAKAGTDRMARITEETDWSAVRTQAERVLSPTQFAALQSVIEEKRLGKEINKILGR